MSAIWPTKIRNGDVALLRQIGSGARLVAHVPRVWKLTRDGQTSVAATPPPGADGLRWRSVLHAGQGLTLGGQALGDEGFPVYRGQNIFPTGLAGAEPKRWDGRSKILMKRFHLYDSLLDRGRLFAGRKIAQLPTVAKVDFEDAMFQDTVIAIQLNTDLPLHVWVLGRPVQWYAAKLVRSGMLEDLGSSWHKRQYLSLPAPAADLADYAELERVGRSLLAADLDLADANRHVDDALRQGERVPLSRLIADNQEVAAGFALAKPLSQPAVFAQVEERGDRVRTDNPDLELITPNTELRTFLAYQLRLKAEAGEALSTDDLVAIRVPISLGPVVAEIRRLAGSDPLAAFDVAHRALDLEVGRLLQMTEGEVSVTAEAMREEPFFKEINPSYAHRGFRDQPYRADARNPYR